MSPHSASSSDSGEQAVFAQAAESAAVRGTSASVEVVAATERASTQKDGHALELYHSDGGGLQRALHEAWAHRELLFFLTWRDVKIRYKQTALGVLWAVIQPLLTMAIFIVLFGRVAGISTDGVPRPIFYFSGLVPWLYVAAVVGQASMSLVTNIQVLTKIYFPRVMLPAGVALSGLVDFLIGSTLLIGFCIYYHIHPGWAVLLWPALVVQMILLVLGISLFLATLNVQFRDVKYVIPFMVQIWMFATPVIYPVSIIPARFRLLMSLNPATGLIEAFRHSVDPAIPVNWGLWGVSAALTMALFVGGSVYFHRSERAFADVI